MPSTFTLATRLPQRKEMSTKARGVVQGIHQVALPPVPERQATQQELLELAQAVEEESEEVRHLAVHEVVAWPMASCECSRAPRAKIAQACSFA